MSSSTSRATCRHLTLPLSSGAAASGGPEGRYRDSGGGNYQRTGKSDPAVVKAIYHEDRTGTAPSISPGPPIPSGQRAACTIILVYMLINAQPCKNLSPCRQVRLKNGKNWSNFRALEAGMRIDVAMVDTVPLGVDTPETLEKARKYYVIKWIDI